METIETAELVAFLAVARAGSFTRAAVELGTRKAHLSRVVSRLEARLGARLLHRTTRSLSLTEVGRELYERGAGVVTAMDEAVRAVRRSQASPAGTVRVTCGVEFGLLVVQRWIARYLARYPDTRVEADFTNRLVDLVHEGFDVGIRVGALEPSGLVVRRLGHVEYGLFAPRGVKVRAPGDLARVPLVLSTQTRERPDRWRLLGPDGTVHQVRLRPRLLVNTHLAVRDAVAAGVGVGLLPVFQAARLVREGKAVRVLPGWGREPVPVHAVFSSSRFLAPRVRAFVDEAVEGFRELAAGRTGRAASPADR